jgi:hypothetical protein
MVLKKFFTLMPWLEREHMPPKPTKSTNLLTKKVAKKSGHKNLTKHLITSA